MGFNIEPKILILRGGKNFKKLDDPFEFVATINISNGIAQIQGALGQLPTADVRVFFNSLKKLGVHKVIWERLRSKQIKTIEIDITKGCKFFSSLF